jgi:hypothetical protein
MMQLENDRCQACQAASVEAVIADDPGEPRFLVCRACENRLQTRSLRPLEWFNLAALHGPWTYLLGSDFYCSGEEDHGSARQPYQTVEEPERFPAPTVDEIRDDQERLIDYAITLHFFDAPSHEKLLAALSAATESPDQKQAFLESLKRRLARSTTPGRGPNLSLAGTVCALCGRFLGPFAADWIRELWEPEHLRSESFLSLAEATAACLPFDEGWRRVTHQLESWSHQVQALAYFRSPLTLDWMEENRIGASTDTWGRAAAVSHFTWSRARAWLEMGTPLSHIALAAIQACQRHDTMLTRNFAPVLEEPAPVAEMLVVLNHYSVRDPAPEVQKRVERILAVLKLRDQL